jgi:sugar/nucleoside kinase (ribokinase family)
VRRVDGVTVVVGDVMEDVVVRPLVPSAPDTDTASVIDRRPGGSAANQASWLAHLGVAVRLAGRVGAGDAARLTAALVDAGVDARLAADHDLPTGTVVVVVGAGGRRDMYTDRGANATLVGADLPPDRLLDGAGHLHVSGYALVSAGSRAGVAGLVAAARRRGMAVTVDPGSAAELARWTAGPADLLAPVGAVDVMLPNLDEGRLLAFGPAGSQAPDADVVDAILASGTVARGGIVALKLGAGGVLVGCGAARERLPAATAAADLVDPTGAGDAFAAGMLARWREGDSPLRCAEAGLEAAASAVRSVGARPT